MFDDNLVDFRNAGHGIPDCPEHHIAKYDSRLERHICQPDFESIERSAQIMAYIEDAELRINTMLDRMYLDGVISEEDKFFVYEEGMQFQQMAIKNAIAEGKDPEEALFIGAKAYFEGMRLVINQYLDTSSIENERDHRRKHIKDTMNAETGSNVVVSGSAIAGSALLIALAFFL